MEAGNGEEFSATLQATEGQPTACCSDRGAQARNPRCPRAGRVAGASRWPIGKVVARPEEKQTGARLDEY